MKKLGFLSLGLCAMVRSRILGAGVGLLALNVVAFGTTFTFNADPLGGTNVRDVAVRQIVGSGGDSHFDQSLNLPRLVCSDDCHTSVPSQTQCRHSDKSELEKETI